jgi:hypothetical protein
VCSRISRLLITVVLLVVVASATPVPGFSPKTLVGNSTAIVIGKVEYVSSNPKEGVFAGSPVPAKEYLARVNVDRVVKGAPDLLRMLNLHWTVLLPNWGSAGYSSPPDGRYLMLFLKSDELPDTYTFASSYYPGVFASSSVAKADFEAGAASDEQILDKVIEEMGRFIESAKEDAGERARQLWQLAFVKDSMVHDFASAVVNDSNLDLRDQAIITLLRLKDASYLPVAREELLRAVDGPGSNERAGNLVLAITQEFPASESIGVLKIAAKAHDARLRGTVAYAARSTRSASAIPILLPLVDDPDDEVAWNAMHSLGELTNHYDWRPTSKDAEEWQRCLRLWHSYAATSVGDLP